MLLVFPAIVSLDLRRRRWRRCDILCCVDAEAALLNTSCITNLERKFDGEPPKKLQSITRALPPHHEQTVTVLANSEGPTATPSLSSLRSARISPHVRIIFYTYYFIFLLVIISISIIITKHAYIVLIEKTIH